VNIAPVSPADGARYIVGMSPEGAWEGHAQHIACFEYGSWAFTEIQQGWIVWVEDAGENGSGDAFISNGAALVPLSRAPSTLDSLGINTAADSVNRLAVKSDAVLLSHDDISPGSGDMRLALNKLQQRPFPVRPYSIFSKMREDLAARQNQQALA